MSLSPKKHAKLNNPKHAVVSLDSFLGLLSSAYGTEQLDSSILYERESVNWSKISVENLKSIPRIEDNGEKLKKEKAKEIVKVNAATSTSSLKANRRDDGELDESLFSIKSLVKLQQIKSKLDSSLNTYSPSQLGKPESGEHVSKANLKTDVDESQLNRMEAVNASGDNIEKYETSFTPVCGFYVDDINNKIIFDIQFVKKTTHDSEIIPMFHIGEPEISISISDTTKAMKASLKVPKCSLVSKVKYFADVEKEFGLENLDIVVRCNIGVFQWVLQWIMSDIPMCRPSLNVTNLKSILSMANHLGISQLVQECLDFFRQNCHLVLDNDREIEDILDDEILLDLSERFSNTEVEQINNDFQNFKNKLFCSLIKRLADPEPCQKAGHFSSLSSMFQCGFCQKIIHINLIDEVPCRADCTQLTFNGKLKYHHECSSFWNLTKYVESMYEELKDWRLVYWQLWGTCHFFYCEVCKRWYPMSQSDWCSYHPGAVEYFPMKNNLLYPIGTYGCCGVKTYRFDTLKQECGCKYKSHISKLDTLEKVEQFNIHQEFKQLINIDCPDNPNIKQFVKLVKANELCSTQNESTIDNFWWSGIVLAPEEKKDYSLIPLHVLNTLRNRPEEKKYPKTHAPLQYGTPAPFGRILPVKDIPLGNDFVGESPSTSRQIQANKKIKPKFSGKKSKTTNIAPVLGPRNRNKKKKSLSFVYQPIESVWTDLESNKDNQDNQRDFEEIAMRNLVQMLTPPDNTGSSQVSSAGSYIRLETEWWQRNSTSHMDKTSSTVVNRTFPLSWFRRLTI